MLTLPSSLRVFAAVQPVDLRKGFDALAIAVRSQLGHDPLSGSLFVFFNRRADRAKVLVWTPSGWCLVFNQRSSHYTSFDSRRGPSPSLRDALRAARSLSRSQRLQCFVGWVAGSS